MSNRFDSYWRWCNGGAEVYSYLSHRDKRRVQPLHGQTPSPDNRFLSGLSVKNSKIPKAGARMEQGRVRHEFPYMYTVNPHPHLHYTISNIACEVDACRGYLEVCMCFANTFAEDILTWR